MAENPLLPNTELRRLLEITRRCARLDAIAARKGAKQPGKRATRASVVPVSREALLAGSAMQLQTGDLLVSEPKDTTALALAPAQNGTAKALLPDTGLSSALLAGVAIAAALRSTGTDRLALQYANAGTTEPGWTEALEWAQQRLLPWILVCADARGPQAFRANSTANDDVFTWGTVHRTAAKLQLPVLTVDGEDAVAVYRVMQESVLRARVGGGPAVIWAMLPFSKTVQASRPRMEKPVVRLERYLKARNIAY